jgi:MFS family permease
MRKWTAAVLVSAYSFISPVSSSMVAPALVTVKVEFHIRNSVESQVFMSIFVLAYAVGPLSEMYGRIIIIQLCNCIYLLFNTLCGITKTPAEMMVFRIFAGVGGSAPLSVCS